MRTPAYVSLIVSCGSSTSQEALYSQPRAPSFSHALALYTCNTSQHNMAYIGVLKTRLHCATAQEVCEASLESFPQHNATPVLQLATPLPPAAACMQQPVALEAWGGTVPWIQETDRCRGGRQTWQKSPAMPLPPHHTWPHLENGPAAVTQPLPQQQGAAVVVQKPTLRGGWLRKPGPNSHPARGRALISSYNWQHTHRVHRHTPHGLMYRPSGKEVDTRLPL